MSYWIEIYKESELNELINNQVITQSFWVNSSNVNKLQGVKEIRIGNLGSVNFNNLIDIGILESIDCDFSFWGNLKSLKNLKMVGGTLRFGAPLKSLGFLEEVGGDLRPTTNELCDLGNLKKVGGTADFRGMVNLTNLKSLDTVGGNLNLVKSLKNQYDLSNINVGGRVIYWNKEPKYYLSNSKSKQKEAPKWENRDPYEFQNNLVHPNKNQLSFYNYFVSNFENGIYVDVGDMRNYIRYFIYSSQREYNIDSNFDKLVNTYQILQKEYPNLAHDTTNIEVEIGRNLGLKKYKEIVMPHEEHEVWKERINKLIIHNKSNTSYPTDDSSLLEILVMGYKKNTLTKFGRQNLDAVLEKLILTIRKIESDDHEPFSRRFFDKNKYHKTTDQKKVFDIEYYEIFFDNKEKYAKLVEEHHKRNIGVPLKNKLYPVYYPTIVEFAIENYIKGLTRESENLLRIERGLPRVGEGWISETNLYYRIKKEFPNYSVIHHGRVNWLGMQHFDIYFPELNIAIEYQGKQHNEPIEFFGGKEGFSQTRENDLKKKKKCLLNNCILIEVFPDYNFNLVIEKVKNAIEKKANNIV